MVGDHKVYALWGIHGIGRGEMETSIDRPSLLCPFCYDALFLPAWTLFYLPFKACRYVVLTLLFLFLRSLPGRPFGQVGDYLALARL